MKKPWSISTTVRNPYRLRDFLSVLKELEGQPFNPENQMKYQTLLIKNKVYRPTNLTKEQEEYFKDIEKDMDFSIAQEIFNSQNYKDPAMRGRNSAAPLNKMGFCIAKQSFEEVKITSLGKYFLSEDYDLGKLFIVHFLKWQLPNPASKSFSKKDGFAIKPFIGTLHLIHRVNKLWSKLGHNPIGISKEEFSLFAPTLINYKNIKYQARKIIEYRVGLRLQKDDKSRKKFRDNYGINFAKLFLGTDKNSEIKKLLKNLKDYGDNAIRYFRLTRLLHIRGNGFYIDLEPRRFIELEKILSTDSSAPLKYKNADQYIQYLADFKQPVLPWETKQELIKIAVSLNSDVQNYITSLKEKVKKFLFLLFRI